MSGRAAIALVCAFMSVLGAVSKPQAAPASNPLLEPWIGPAGGVPPFDRVRIADFKPALQTAMAENLAEINKIAQNPAAPNFENTIVALERGGRTFNRVSAIYGVWSSTMSGEEFQAVEREMQPQLAAFSDKIYQNAPLFSRIAAVYGSMGNLTPVEQRLCWLYYTNFVRAGAKLSPAAKMRVAAINERLATLFANFSQNLLADEADHALYLREEKDLAGLPEPLRAAARAAAAARGHGTEWAVLNTRSSMDPFLTYADRRDLREIVWRTYYSRGDNGDAHDNKKIITEILGLRAERANLLGYPTHAHWRVADSMAKTPENAMSLMMQVWPAAVAREHEEVADMQKIADAEHAGIRIAPWDYRYYAEKVRKAKYDIEMNEVKPYLQLEKLREGMFWAAGQLYGFTFTQVYGLPAANPDVRVWEVKNAADAHVGFWYFDPYARPGKNSGAWMSEYRGQEKLDQLVSPIVSNNTNFVKDESGGPLLISWDDAVTLFHEFGHALHGLNSDVKYPSLAGTNVVRDFVEFPSQLNENWLSTPEVLSRFAVHYQTGKAIPPELVAKIKKASTFNQGFATVEYLASALVDMKLHLAGRGPIDPDAFERTTLRSLGMPVEMVMRHRTPQFAHIFSSDAYSAGYYSYLWAEVLDHDAFEAFTEAGGPYDKTVAKRLHDDVMAVGNGVDPGQAYRNFRGAEPRIDALLRARGFAPKSNQARAAQAQSQGD
ncbi:MAG TPA: M3 family metallopeptidase [Steroidobacteraceae bacterium]|jgi:peptidyl-dipeptidase Dcp